MKQLIKDNKISVKDIRISAQGFIDRKVVLNHVSLSYAVDEQKKRTSKVEAIRYECTNPADFSTFTIKVPSAEPVITAGELEAAEEPVFIEIPLDEVIIKPYKIEYGIATVSITAPYVQLATGNGNKK